MLIRSFSNQLSVILTNGTEYTASIDIVIIFTMETG